MCGFAAADVGRADARARHRGERAAETGGVAEARHPPERDALRRTGEEILGAQTAHQGEAAESEVGQWFLDSEVLSKVFCARVLRMILFETFQNDTRNNL